ncbi:hypothetical protein D3C87_348130 [compost metagenome]
MSRLLTYDEAIAALSQSDDLGYFAFAPRGGDSSRPAGGFIYLLESMHPADDIATDDTIQLLLRVQRGDFFMEEERTLFYDLSEVEPSVLADTMADPRQLRYKPCSRMQQDMAADQHIEHAIATLSGWQAPVPARHSEIEPAWLEMLHQHRPVNHQTWN